MISYSIIIPSRNFPDLLRRALESIPRRDDIQIIVVDDASDPEVVDFDDYPGAGDEHVELVFSKDRGGAGHARNQGLALAMGRWTLFMDSDDFFMPGFEMIADSHLEDSADIIFFNVTSVFSDSLEYSRRHLSRSEYFTGFTGAGREFCCRYLYTEPWGKMFRTSFLREKGISFEEVPLANDFRFSIQSGINAARVICDERKIYCVTEREGSLSNDFCSTPEQLSVRLGVYKGVQDLLDSAGVSSYPFYKLVNFTLRHRPEFIPLLKEFCQGRGVDYKRLKIKTFIYRVLFSRYHRRHWAIF